MSQQLEREEEYLYQAYERGEMSQKELNYELNELHRSFQEYAEEQAQEAYDSSMRNSGYY